MFISIVTVSYNNNAGLQRTAQSVINQDFGDYEYIIIDGSSTDGTIESISRIKEQCNDKGISFHAISEKDNGPYDAMNKGANLAKGDYLFFLNSGDSLYNKTVLSCLCFEANTRCKPDIIYGSTKVISLGLYKNVQPEPLIQLRKHMIFCHQSSICKRSVFMKYMFDTSYTVSADYKLFLQLYLDSMSFKEVNFVVSVFYLGGISSDLKRLYDETNEVKHSFGIIDNDDKVSIKDRIHYYVKKVAPQKITKHLMKLNDWCELEQ